MQPIGYYLIINCILSRGWSHFHPRGVSRFHDDNFPSGGFGALSFLVFIYILFDEALM